MDLQEIIEEKLLRGGNLTTLSRFPPEELTNDYIDLKTEIYPPYTYGNGSEPFHDYHARVTDILVETITNPIKNIPPLEICITLKPKWTDMSARYVRDLIIGVIEENTGLLTEHCRKTRIHLLYELSDTGRLHYHGVILNYTKPVIYNLRRSLNKIIGRTEIKPIGKLTNYYKYMMKDRNNIVENEIHPQFDIHLEAQYEKKGILYYLS